MKDHLVRSVLPEIDVAGNSGLCHWKMLLSELMKKTSTFKKQNTDNIYHIYKPLNINFKNTLPVPKPSFVIGLTIIKVLTITLRTRKKFRKKL